MEPMLINTENISCSMGRAQIDSLISGVMQLSKRDRRSSSIKGKEEENKFLKYEVKQLPISRLSEDQTPEGSLRKSKAFLRCLIIVEV